MAAHPDKIICIGKNYLDHAKELGDAVPENPVLFLKPWSSSLQATTEGELLNVELPKTHGAVHFDCEIVALLNADLQIKAVTLGLDLTLRELQSQLKKNGHPWEVSKVFKNSAVLGAWIPVVKFSNYLEKEFSFFVNRTLKQYSKGNQMRFSPIECIKYASEFFQLCEGDALFTGTPAGVGPIKPGDKSELTWDKKSILKINWL
ncbi:MAG: fumarylacetoacetate hydrolase family protein [Bdellovibrionales bacterium]